MSDTTDASLATGPYPDPHMPVDVADIHVGDVLRYILTNSRGERDDPQDYFVTEIETEPCDLIDGKPLSFPCRRLYVTIVIPPAADAAPRTLGNVQLLRESTPIVDSSDELVRADRRHTVALSCVVATLAAEASK